MDSIWARGEGDIIPTDILVQILMRLPAKAIVRCLLICKTWYSLIKSPHFISIHLKHFRPMAHSHLILKEGSFGIYSESGGTLIEQESGRIPFPVFERHLYILGYCKGLLLVRLRVESGWLVFLWNPCVEKFKVIDTVDFGSSGYDGRFEPYCLSAFALAFHEPSNDYRVVRIANGPGKHFPGEVDVYSLIEDKWHQVDGTLTDGTLIPNTAHSSKMAYYIEGAVHWIAYNKVENFWHFDILSFDFDLEVFKVIDLPTPLSTVLVYTYQLDLKEVDEKLALFVGYPWESQLNTWLMMKYPSVESWTDLKLLFSHQGRPVLRPLVCTRSGNCVCRPQSEWEKLFYFNVQEDRQYDLGVVTPYTCPCIIDFVECLVLLDGGDAVLNLNP